MIPQHTFDFASGRIDVLRQDPSAHDREGFAYVHNACESRGFFVLSVSVGDLSEELGERYCKIRGRASPRSWIFPMASSNVGMSSQ